MPQHAKALAVHKDGLDLTLDPTWWKERLILENYLPTSTSQPHTH